MHAEENNELTLQGLAQRLETLERENTELRSKVATLEDSGMRRYELALRRGSDTPRDGEPATEEFAGRVSRRSLLSKAGAAALAAVAAGTLLNPRESKANHLDPGIKVDSVDTHTVVANNFDGFPLGAVDGFSGPKARFGVVGTAENPTKAGVYGIHHGQGGNAVLGLAPNGTGVIGKGNGTSGNFGVLGEGGQTGVVGFGNTYAGVVGRGAQFGGVFKAEKSGAQLYLQPGESRDRPTIGDHSRGELYMDATGTLFVCTDGGNPGVWRVFQTGPA